MAYFHCLIGGGSSGGGYELTVTCDSQFAGTTITCTDGVTTLTKTCPSASPYEVVFELPNGGDWTISGVVGGSTVSTGVSIPTSVELIAFIQQTVTIYSATEDTITFTDASGARTEVFESGESSKIVNITIQPGGQSVTFTSSVAKNPNDSTEYYSKTVTVDENTTDVYIMPDNVLYWYGYLGSVDGIEIEAVSNANGWGSNAIGATFNTNDITCTSTSGAQISGIGTKDKVILANYSKITVINTGVTANAGTYAQAGALDYKGANTEGFGTYTTAGLNKKEWNISSWTSTYYINICNTANNRNIKIHAVMIE